MPDDPAAPGAARWRTFAALAENPDYRRFYLGQGVSLVGTWLQDAAVSWIVFEMTRSEWYLGLIGAAGTLPGLLVGLPAGAVADRAPPRAMVLAMQLGQMALAFLLAALVALGVVQIWQMALVLALTRVCVTFEMPSRQVFLYEIVGRKALGNAIALNSGLFNASKVIGPALAGLCLARLGRTACFALNGASYLAAIAALLTIRPRPRPAATPRGDGLGLGAGLAYLVHDRRVGWLFARMAFFGAVGMGYSALLPSYAAATLGLREIGFSVLLSSAGLGATAGALAIASAGSGHGREGLVCGGMTLFGLALAAAGVAPILGGRAGPAAAALCLFAAGAGAVIFYAGTQTLIQTAVPDELRGRVMGIWMIVFSGSVPLGSLWAGAVARRYGVPLVLEVVASICLAVGLPGWLRAEAPKPARVPVEV